MILQTDEEHRVALIVLDNYMEVARSVDDGIWIEVLSAAIVAFCAQKGHQPVKKMSAVICDRCRVVLEER